MRTLQRLWSVLLLAWPMAILAEGQVSPAGAPGASAEVAGQSMGAPMAADLVRERSRARWQALLKLDYESAYRYLGPGVRSTMPLELYKSRSFGRTIEWKDAKIAAVVCEPELCRVDVDLSYVYLGRMQQMYGQVTTSRQHEKWILAEGEWWYIPEK